MIIDRLASKIGSFVSRRTSASRLGSLLLVGAASSLAACTDPPIDTNQPPVTGVIAGAVQYIGPRVPCVYEGGVPVEVKGRILMTLNDVANPLPPLGQATQPADFFAIGGEDIFVNLAADCLPEVPVAADFATNIQRTIPFTWSAIKMGAAIPAAERAPDGTFTAETAAKYTKNYTIQGFYDQEGDFNPLFSVAQSTSAGDIAGGALSDPLGGTSAYRVITMASVSVNSLGDVVPNVNVTLAAPVLTDPPIFRVQNGAISSQATVPTAVTATNLPLIELTLYERATGTDARDRLDRSMSLLDIGGFANFADPLAYSWYLQSVDVDGDGDVASCAATPTDKDCHPLLGASAFRNWNSPVVLMQRIQNAIEAEANVPLVALIPNAGMEASNPSSQYPVIPMRVYPLAAVQPNPAHSECQAAYFADNSSSTIVNGSGSQLPPGAIIECNEIPTGYYSVNTLTGLVATPATHVCPNPADPTCPVVDGTNSQTGLLVTGAAFGAQVWSIPNELGDWHQVGDPLASDVVAPGEGLCLSQAESARDVADNLCVPEQGLNGAVIVHDPDVANPYGRRDPNAVAGGVCLTEGLGNYTALATNGWANDPAREDDYNDLCCRPIMHLCSVPLCPYVEGGRSPVWASDASEQNLNVRSAPTSIVGHVTTTIEGVEHTYGIPNCISFPMPSQCCDAGNQP